VFSIMVAQQSVCDLTESLKGQLSVGLSLGLVCLVAVTSGEVDSNGFATCSLLSWAGGCCLAIVVAVASGTSPSQGLEAHSLLQQTSEKLAVMGQAWRHIPPTPTVWTRR
jgi:hypothetical protein